VSALTISHCARCSARFTDQLGLRWHEQAAHPEERAQMEDHATRPRFLEDQMFPGAKPPRLVKLEIIAFAVVVVIAFGLLRWCLP
jgi:hypothetical protein